MKKMIILLGCVWGMMLSCSKDPQDTNSKQSGNNVHEWQDSTLSGDAVMGEKMMFRVGDSLQVIRKASTRLSTAFDGQNYTLSGDDRITIAMKRGSEAEVIKIYKVKDADTGALEYEKDADGNKTEPFYWKSTTETVKLRAWSYGTSEAYTSDPLTTPFTLNTTQTELAVGKDNYRELLYDKQRDYPYAANITLNLYHQLARVTVQLTHSDTENALSIAENGVTIGGGVLPTSAQFVAPTDNSNVGSWNDLQTNTGTVIARTDVANQKYSAVLFPKTYSAGTKIVGVRTTAASPFNSYAYTLPSSGEELVAGKQYSYKVNVRDLVAVSSLTISNIAAVTYNGSAQTPEPTVTDSESGKVLTKDIHYTLSYINNTNAGDNTAVCRVNGLGIYSGTQDKTFTINRCPTTLTFDASSETVDYIWNQTKYNLTKSPSNATVEFTSSNTALVGVDASTGTLKGGTAFTNSGTATITVTATGNYIGSATYTVTTSKGNYTVFSYNGTNGTDGSVQSITLPKSTYKMECWGAKGASTTTAMYASYLGTEGGGDGGYVSGNISFDQITNIYIYVGGKGQGWGIDGNSNLTGGWNGGGNAYGGSSGSGATDMRLKRHATSTVWNDAASLRSRIIVAAAGGGWDWTDGGEAGGLLGYSGYLRSGNGHSTRATTNSGGEQEIGGSGYVKGSFGYGGGVSNHNSGGGGSGWYGGGLEDGEGGGAGGSSFISGHSGCSGWDNSLNKHTGVGNPSKIDGKTYSFIKDSSMQMIDGEGYLWPYNSTSKGSLTAMPNPSGGTYTSGGHTGHGYARISFVSQ